VTLCGDTLAIAMSGAEVRWNPLSELAATRLCLGSRAEEVLLDRAVEGVPTKNRDSDHTWGNESIEGREQK
jgi:hypothetical protein